MKSLLKSACLMFLCFATTSIVAQDADDIIKDYLKAIGGTDRLSEITTLKFVGESSSPQGSAPVTRMQKAPNMSKMVLNVMGNNMIFAYDGETAWMSNPFQGGGKPTKMEGPQAKRFSSEEIQDPFLNYADKGSTVKLLGEEDVNDETHYKIRLTKESGDEMIYYFNAETSLPTQMKMLMTEGQAKGSILVITFGDYKEVDGIMMPHIVDQTMDGNSISKFSVNEIMVNADIPDAEFTFPEEKQ